MSPRWCYHDEVILALFSKSWPATSPPKSVNIKSHGVVFRIFTKFHVPINTHEMGRFLGWKKWEKSANLLQNFLSKIRARETKKEARKKFENPREISLGWCSDFPPRNQEKVLENWKPISWIVAECGEGGKEDKISVKKLVSGQEWGEITNQATKRNFGASRWGWVRPWVSKKRERKNWRELGCRELGFGLKQSPSEVKNFGAIRGARPVVVAAKKKRKVLGSKLENQIPNPRGKPFNPELLNWASNLGNLSVFQALDVRA